MTKAPFQAHSLTTLGLKKQRQVTLAVEAPGATPSHALADTKGHVLRVLALFFLALAPWLAAAIGGVLLFGRGR
jgi:hypothetical protein